MNGKQKFFALLGLLQIVLIFTVFFSVDGLVGFVSAQTTNFDYYNSSTSIGLAIGAGMSVGMGVIGSGMALKTVGTAAIATLSEREESFFKAFLVVALAEALAIYGLIVAMLLWTKIPNFA
jgi:F0F1-type ATP synthase membrane subunit c/vacuolar-type H+-ATPase subunit K